jgi:hypothetical protein
MNKESEKIWMEVVIAYFKALSWNLPGGTEENQSKTLVEIANLQAQT